MAIYSQDTKRISYRRSARDEIDRRNMKSAARQAFHGWTARWRREELRSVVAQGQGVSKRRFRARRRVLLTRGAAGGGGWRIRGGALAVDEKQGQGLAAWHGEGGRR